MARVSEYTIHGPPAIDYHPSQHPHKSLPIRREPKANPADLRTLYRHSADDGVLEDVDQRATSQNGVPSTPVLPPTPPAVNGETPEHAHEESSTDAATFRASLATPINHTSPPTPDNTPPRERSLLFARPFLGTQVSLVSTRAESFRTAQEDFGSEQGSPSISPKIAPQTPCTHSYYSRVTSGVHVYPPNALTRSALRIRDDVTAAQQYGSDVPAVHTIANGEETGQDAHKRISSSGRLGEEGQLGLQPSAIDEGGRIETEEIPIGLQIDGPPEQTPDHIPASGNVRRGPSLRDRLKVAEHFSPTASTEKFASIIGWTNSVNHGTNENKRASGISTTSTIGAIVVESSSLPRRRTTLRKIAKHDSLRCASSPLPDSKRASQVSSNDSPHRLVHKKVRLSNDNRMSFGSEPSRSHSMSSSAVLPKMEVIKVAVIPERTSSLQSSAASSRRHSVSGTSHKTQISKGSNGLPPSSWQPKRTVSDSQDRAREQQQDVVVPPRSSSLSAPTSRTTSRANSITSDSVRVQRRMAEKDLRKTLDRMESDRLLSSLQKVHKQEANEEPRSAELKSVSAQPTALGPTDSTPSRLPKKELPHVNLQLGSIVQYQNQATPGTSEWAALRPPSILDTPFSQPSYQSASPEVKEARAISFFPHNNDSLQIVEPNLTQESRAVREVRKEDYLKHETQSHLRHPRPPPEPPKFNVIPPSPGDEMERRLADSRSGSTRRRLSQQRSASFMTTISRGLSLKNAKNRKASQELDSNLHPFWRPRPFWDDLDPATKLTNEEEQRLFEKSGPVNNSLGFPHSDTVITGPVSLIRRISERRRQNRTLVKQSSQSSLARIRVGRKLYKSPFLGFNLRFMGLRDMQERMLFARQRKEDERREKRRAALRESIGANVVSQGDSRFPLSSSSLVKS